MARQQKSKEETANRKAAVIKQIGDFFTTELKKGAKPWNRPWDLSKCTNALPHNIVSNKAYRGVNVWILGFTGDNEFGSFKQWAQVGNKHAIKNGEYELAEDKKGKPYKKATTYYGVKKGETAHTIVYFSMIKIENDKFPSESPDKYIRIPLLKYHKVFGRSQTTLPPVEADPDAPKLDMTRRETAVENFMFRNYLDPNDIQVTWGGTRAYYRVGTDNIGMPDRHAFPDGFAMLPTLLHEAIHSTGHASRLKRKFGIFGDEDYAFEELVAEMGASILCRWFNILPGEALEEGLENQVSYINNWLKRLESNPNMIIKAGARAQAAVDHILKTEFGEDAPVPTFDEEQWAIEEEEE